MQGVCRPHTSTCKYLYSHRASSVVEWQDICSSNAKVTGSNPSQVICPWFFFFIELSEVLIIQCLKHIMCKGKLFLVKWFLPVTLRAPDIPNFFRWKGEISHSSFLCLCVNATLTEFICQNIIAWKYCTIIIFFWLSLFFYPPAVKNVEINLQAVLD